MNRIAIAAAAVLAAAAGPALAQSTTRSTTTTTVTEEGNTTTVRSTTRETTVGVDGEALVGALVGALAGQDRDRGGVWLPRGEPARPEDAFGAWSVRDRDGRASGACVFEMAERGFLGGRGIRTRDCHGVEAHYYRMAAGEVVVFRNPDVEVDRLRLVDGHLVGRRLLLSRPGQPDPEWGPDWAHGGGRADDRRGGWSGGWGRRLDLDAVTGGWRSIEDRNGFRRECQVTLGAESRFSGHAISSSGCFGDLMSVAYWRLEDGRVAIYRPGGALLAMLSGDGRRLSGQGPSGEIVLYR